MSTPLVRITRGLGVHRTYCNPIAEERKAETERIRQKFPGRIPVRPLTGDEVCGGGLIC